MLESSPYVTAASASSEGRSFEQAEPALMRD
jgi:hypothetical protein